MEGQKAPKPRQPRHIEVRRSQYSAGERWAIALAILGVVGLLALVGLLVARSRRAQAPPPRATAPSTPLTPAPAPRPDATPADEKEDEEWLKKYVPPESPEKSGRRSLRQRIEAEYDAAKRRVELYVKQDRWGDAIAALERVMDRYDDEELRLRADPELVDLRRQANHTCKKRMAEADKLVEAGRYAEARKILEGVAATFSREEYVEPAKERLKQIGEREDAEAAAHFARSMAAVDAILPSWRFDEALAEARKLRFDRPQYQQALVRRIERFQALQALKAKIIDRIIEALPRLDKRLYGVPGLPGELVSADAEVLHAITAQGKEKIPWERLGPEGTARLGLLAGKPQDPKHRLAVARLLLEVGHLERAKQELEKAKELGADVAADAAELARREAEPPKKEKAE